MARDAWVGDSCLGCARSCSAELASRPVLSRA